MAMNKKDRARLFKAVLYLSPNLVGFLVFVLFPLVVSLVMAFTNWDLKQHNTFHPDVTPTFVGFQNFMLLFTEEEFPRYLGNTLIMMLGIPFGMAGSLIAAMLLSGALRGKSVGDKRHVIIGCVITTVVMLFATVVLMLTGMTTTALAMVIAGAAGLLMMSGSLTGSTPYRTVFYLPSFTSGVAIFLLWKKIYNPTNGPLNNALEGPLTGFSSLIAALPGGLVQSGLVIGYLLLGLAGGWVCLRLRRMYQDGEMGGIGLVVGSLLMALAGILGWLWSPGGGWGITACIVATIPLLLGLGIVIQAISIKRPFTCKADDGLGTGLMLAGAIFVVQVSLLGLGLWALHLPAQAAEGLQPPYWLTNYHWAKPALIIMGLWAAIGSNNMLLYLAGLSGVPQSLYEAANIDGAKGFKRFWNVTWPQLAPVTFFIFVMSMIHGLQGGFEMAKTMTEGGPAGSTTTLAYYIYAEGFETGRLGFASAVAWAMFALVFAVTIFNWKFGAKYTDA